MLCLVCEKDISKNHFPQHLVRYHNLSKEDYKIKFNLQNYCSCGCEIKIKDSLKWARGHHQRINNISKREDIKELRRQKMQEWHNSGGWQPWNKGLTTEDERVKSNIESLNKVWEDEKYREKQSKRMQKYWDEGKIIPLTKEKSSRWKGGTSTLIQRLRASHKLYGEWKYPILKRDNFICQKCGIADGKLNIHHNIEKMCEILQKFVSKEDRSRTFDGDSVIIDKIVQYHIDNNVSGITLCKPCHKKEHEINKDSD